jgi:membrane protein YdbS with pleckstrin-like domain
MISPVSTGYDRFVPFPAENLNDDEQIVLDIRPHWWFFVRPVALLMIPIVFGVVSIYLGAPSWAMLGVAGLIGLALLWFLTRYMVWTSTNFVITTDRLINRSGVINRQGIEIPLERVNTVFFSQRLFERVIGCGDLIIESAGEQGSQTVSDIRKPLNVQNEIYRQMENNENRKFDRVGRNLSAGGGVGGGAMSIPHQIEKLADLHRLGVLTDAEFTQKKQQLLDRM